MPVITRNPEAAWLRTLAHFLSHERRFTGDSTLPNGESTVDGLRRIAEQHQGAVAENERLRLQLAGLQGAFNSLHAAARSMGAMAERINAYRGQSEAPAPSVITARADVETVDRLQHQMRGASDEEDRT